MPNTTATITTVDIPATEIPTLEISSGDSTFPAITAKRSQGAQAVLATIAAALGSPIGLREIRSVTEGARIEHLDAFLTAASLLGLRAQAMEGGYDDLDSVDWPLVMVLRAPSIDAKMDAADDEKRSFTVLHRMDAEGALLADPRKGLIRLSRAELESIWTGDVVALERHPAAEEEALEALRQRRNPSGTLIWAVLSVAIVALTWLQSPANILEAAAFFGLAIALSAALGSNLRARACAACDRASKLVGALPIAPLGVMFYGALWSLFLFAPGHVSSTFALAAAVGVHGALVALLRRYRLLCRPCLVTAGAALVAAGSALVAASPSIPMLAAFVAVLGSSWIASARGLSLAREVFAWRRRAATFDLARSLAAPFAEAPAADAASPRQAHMVVYKRPGCSACAIFDATIRPGLEETFGSHLRIETRVPDDPAVPTPLVVVSGEGTPLVVDVQEQEAPFDVLTGAIGSALGGKSNSSFAWVG